MAEPANTSVRRSPAQPGSARGIELALLALAAVVVTVALVLVEAEQDHQLSLSLVYLGLGYLGLFGAAHVVVRRTAPYADPLILPTVALLNGLGLVMIHRLDLTHTTAALTPNSGMTPTPSNDATRQLAWTAVGVVLLAATLIQIRDHRLITRYAYLLGLGGLSALLLPGLLPASISEVNGAKLWIHIGSISIQPGEFAKIMIIAFVASFLVSKRELFRLAGQRFLGMELPRVRDLAPLVVAWAVSVGVLTLERELGASLLIFGVVLAMVYVATSRVSWVVVGLLFFVAGSVVAYQLYPHVRARVQVWSDPGAYYFGSGYQLSQSLFGLGTGGLGGTGLGAGHPALVPLANADFIAAALGEELGLFGLGALVVLYLLLIVSGLKTALLCRDSFGTLLASGLSMTIALQTFLVIGGISNLIPLTGLTTPFLSYGGSSLLANYILIALLLRMSNAARRPTSPTPSPRAPLSRATTELVANPPRGKRPPADSAPDNH